MCHPSDITRRPRSHKAKRLLCVCVLTAHPVRCARLSPMRKKSWRLNVTPVLPERNGSDGNFVWSNLSRYHFTGEGHQTPSRVPATPRCTGPAHGSHAHAILSVPLIHSAAESHLEVRDGEHEAGGQVGFVDGAPELLHAGDTGLVQGHGDQPQVRHDCLSVEKCRQNLPAGTGLLVKQTVYQSKQTSVSMTHIMLM